MYNSSLKSSFKMISLFYFGNFSIGQASMIVALAEILVLSTLMGYISFKTEKTTMSIASGVSLSTF
ncbi:hypothetical protein [Clostridium botulinum]|uniref:Uncharacterized protein n=1 Tax=Clostridium botulinum TaxID=1491 RepID=A0A6G4EDV0_CLOBO|nr:hypothetical protein [Clostridium botulinum]MBE1303755.1 hypothetical protein [Clostridium botulinum]NFB14242.1 hypothetical protein [Clostridium botulinum]NFH58472.1 hypothetical protein [Clostridium botulinum]NFH61421.1 hypothetical protein [Clostridium botulinum]NFI08958.1 hypothetical protein [Clostridium botulinum]